MVYPPAMPATPKTVILAAEPFDSHASAIADQLRQSGWDPIITPTPQHYISHAQICIVFLGDDAADNLTVSGAQQAGFASLIPVLLQPMALPDGAWSAGPILVGASDAAAGRAIADTLARIQGGDSGSLPAAPVVAAPVAPPDVVMTPVAPPVKAPFGTPSQPPANPFGVPSSPPAFPTGMPDTSPPLFAPTSPGPAFPPASPSYPPPGSYPPTAPPAFPGAGYPPPLSGSPPPPGPQKPWLRIAIIGVAAVVVVIVIVLVLVLRGGGLGGGTPSSIQHSLTGTWNETFTSNNVSYQTTMDLTQNGSALTGQIPIHPVSSLTITVPLTGTITGQQITLNGQAQISVAGFPEGATVQETGTVNSAFTSMSGTITVSLVIAVQLDPTQPPTTNTTTLSGPWMATRASN